MFKDLAESLAPNKHIQSPRYEKEEALLSTNMSFRKVAGVLGRFISEDPDKPDSPGVMTICERVNSLGNDLSNAKTAKAKEITKQEDITEDQILQAVNKGEDVEEPLFTVPNQKRWIPQSLPLDMVARIAEFNKGKQTDYKIQDNFLVGDIEQNSDQTIYISVDEVEVTRQKENREKKKKESNTEKEPRKIVKNTVIHIQTAKCIYLITAISMTIAFIQLVAWLIANEYLGKKYFAKEHKTEWMFVFLTDGAKNIRAHIAAFFGLDRVRMELDWFHLVKRMRENLSMALGMKKEQKTEIRKKLCRLLWPGNVDCAIAYLQSIPEKQIKNEAAMAQAISYLQDRRRYIPCYALRKLLGYINSSNRVECSNNILVACRQKKNGMSWSYSGSGALAAITAADRNGELDSWILTQTVSFVRKTKAA